MEYSIYSKHLDNSCCVPGAYNGINLERANPFDRRQIPFQPNPWCSNELILKDKDLRCKARIQPLDVPFVHSLNLAEQDAKAKGLWLHH